MLAGVAAAAVVIVTVVAAAASAAGACRPASSAPLAFVLGLGGVAILQEPGFYAVLCFAVSSA